MPPLRLSARAGLLLAIVFGHLPARAEELDPIGFGPFAVGCTNLEVNPPAGAALFDFLNGGRHGGKSVYLTDILAHPEAVPTVTVQIPDQVAVFAERAGTAEPVVVFVMYPTLGDNPRPDYAFPYQDTGDRILPHMERPGDTPRLVQTGVKFPLILNSGGYNTHPLWHLDHLKMLASHGYIVADIVHGDGRGKTFLGNMARRPLAVRAVLDYLLQRSPFAAAIDPDRIGIAGQSAGGHTALATLGGVDPGGRITNAADPRIKAGFGLVPAMGGSFGVWPFTIDAWYFGSDHHGLRAVQRPFFAVYAAADHNVPPEGVEAGVREISGPVTAVRLDGESHSLTAAANADIFTWEILFFDAWLRGSTTAREQLETGTSVHGGVADHVTFRRPTGTAAARIEGNR